MKKGQLKLPTANSELAVVNFAKCQLPTTTQSFDDNFDNIYLNLLNMKSKSFKLLNLSLQEINYNNFFKHPKKLLRKKLLLIRCYSIKTPFFHKTSQITH